MKGTSTARTILDVVVEYSFVSSDHSSHYSLDRAWYADTGETLFLEGSDWFAGEPHDHLDKLADDVIASLADDLSEGRAYLLRLKMETPDSGPSMHRQFVYTRARWAPRED